MIHKVYLDDTAINGRNFSKELYHYRKDTESDKSCETESVPEGYITSEEFRKRAIEKVNNFCDKHGIL